MAMQATYPEISFASPDGSEKSVHDESDQASDEEAPPRRTQVNTGDDDHASEPESGVKMFMQPVQFLPTDPKITPRVRKCNIAHFKNRFSPNEILNAVDVLEWESTDIGAQLQDELKIRQLPRKRARDRAKIEVPIMGKPSSPGFHFGPSGKMLILRIRIQAPSLLVILCRIITKGEENWRNTPRTFFRPFSPLIFYHESVREYLDLLQERWGYTETLDPTQTPASIGESDHDGSGGRRTVDDCPAALAELKCYVKFIDEEIMPLYTKFENLSSEDKPSAKVRFHDLWYLFRVGELVFRPVGTGANKELVSTALGNRIWRCYGTRPFWAKYRTAPSEHRSYTEEDSNERASFGVRCYYIDYTGEEFCVVTQTFEIPPFPGERSIKSLNVFPYRFATNHTEILRIAFDHGRKFIHTTNIRHATYNGWSTTVTPTGAPSTDVDGKVLRRPEFVDSEVIVDFVEAFQTCPAWKPEAVVLKPKEPIRQMVRDDFNICWWSDEQRSRLVRESNEIIALRTGITTCQLGDNLSEDNPKADNFLIRIRENDRNGKPTTESCLRLDEKDEHCDLPLLPSRIFAYVLRDRRFVQLLVQRLSLVQKSSDAFQYLKINQDHKDLIQCLVEDHFEKKLTDRESGVDINSIDLIKGKGKGLFILLHGVPGVGKTATAEAIAALNGKPLFPITCGDLGLTPAEVETALLRIFRLADTWNCVLLLDEVDTFFSQRAKGDATLAKNALVSVFLRVLEYYDGLLFLTTNRTGALDEAFKSRIHLKLFYPPLGREQTKEIWSMNIDRLEKIEQERCAKTGGQPLKIMRKRILRFAEETFKEKKMERWNGRQIRNAFQIASSLAHYDARKEGTSQPRLTVEHFKMIQTVTDDFDEYMHETIGKTDGEQAFERGDRSDHFVPAAHQQHHHHHEAREAEEVYEEPAMPLSPRVPNSAGGRRRSSFNRLRSVSPNMAAQGHPNGGGGSIFGPGPAANRRPPSPRRERPGMHPRKPSIEVTTSGESNAPRAWGTAWQEEGSGGDTYLSPEVAKNPEDWHATRWLGKRGRDNGEEDGGSGLKRTKIGSDDDDEEDADDD